MKRALTQKVNPIPACEVDSCSMVEPLKPIPPEVNRRARTSAAMIGLAISMGASSLLIPQQGDSAIAAEPILSSPQSSLPTSAVEAAPTGQETTVASALASTQAENPATPAAEATTVKPLVLEHRVQEWQPIGIETSGKAQSVSTREISLNSSSKTSQVEAATVKIENTIPSVSGIGQDIEASQGSESDSVVSDRAGQPTTAEVSNDLSANVNDLLKAKQAVALNRLKESSNRLRNSLAEWKSEESPNQPAGQITEPVTPVVISRQMQPAIEPTGSASEISRWQPKVAAVDPAVQTTTASSEASQIDPLGAISAVYRVKPGDTIDQIARNFQVSPAILAKTNDLDNPDRIQIGQPISIPQAETIAFNQPGALEAEPISPNFAARTQQLASSKTSVPIVSSLASASSANNISVPVVPPANWTPTTVTGAEAINLGTDAVPLGHKSAKFEGPGGIKQIAGPVNGKQDRIPTSGSEPSLFSDDTNQGPQATSKQESNPYVERLRAEVLQLREQYRHQQGSDILQRITSIRRPYSIGDSTSNVTPLNSSSETDSVSSASVPSNAEFNPNRYGEALQAEVQRRDRARSNDRIAAQIPNSEEATAPARKQQMVATAPLGPDVYQPYNQPEPRMVAPELPTLDNPDRYLPGESNPTQNFNGYAWPTRGVLTSGYGWRWGRMHKGIDIAAPTGTPIFASAPGVVVYARWNAGGYGNLVDIRHPDGSLTRYGHNSRILVQEGQAVEQGQQIALMGSTGYSTGPHCHFEVHPTGRGAVNPIAFLPRRRS